MFRVLYLPTGQYLVADPKIDKCNKSTPSAIGLCHPLYKLIPPTFVIAEFYTFAVAFSNVKELIARPSVLRHTCYSIDEFKIINTETKRSSI